MKFTRNDNIISVETKGHLLNFEVISKNHIKVDNRYYLVSVPSDHFELYPSGEDSIIVFREEDENITGFEDDIDIVNQVMEIFQ